MHYVAFRRKPDGTLASPPDVSTYYNVPVVSYEFASNISDLVLLHLDTSYDMSHIQPMQIHETPQFLEMNDEVIALPVGPHPVRGYVRYNETTFVQHAWHYFVDPLTYVLDEEQLRHLIYTNDTPVEGDSGGAIVVEVPDFQTGSGELLLQATPTRFELVATIVGSELSTGNSLTASDVVLMHSSLSTDYDCIVEDVNTIHIECPCDINRDRFVDVNDQNIFLSLVGMCTCNSTCDFFDYDDDGDIDGSDYATFFASFVPAIGTCPCPWDCDPNGVAGDLNGDGCLDGQDYSIWLGMLSDPHPGCLPCLDRNDDGDIVDDYVNFLDDLANGVNACQP